MKATLEHKTENIVVILNYLNLSRITIFKDWKLCDNSKTWCLEIVMALHELDRNQMALSACRKIVLKFKWFLCLQCRGEKLIFMEK